MKCTLPALFLCLPLYLGGCGSTPRDEPETRAPQPPAGGAVADTTMRLSGTVRQVQVEGGCWQFQAEDGRTFELSRSGAPAELFHDGKKATLVLRPRPDLMSTCMVGPIVEVVSVENGG